jgi:predicted DNA-binding protein (MmcQ/YjbR family)
MNLEQVIDYALAKPETEESLPFGPDVLVVKARGKIFILIPLDSHPLQFNLKCDPERALELREEHAAIVPGYHMNKKHWNTLIMDGSLPATLVKELIDHSYDLVRGRMGATGRKDRNPDRKKT